MQNFFVKEVNLVNDEFPVSGSAPLYDYNDDIILNVNPSDCKNYHVGIPIDCHIQFVQLTKNKIIAKVTS